MGLKVVLKKDEKEIGSFEMNEKRFKTGSVGYHAFGKIEIDGKKYQANFMLIEIGSKKKNEVSL
jgi:hypothetical protein